MKLVSHSLAAIALLAVWSMSALAQTPAADGKQLSKDGLSFNYPNGWTLVDESNADAAEPNPTPQPKPAPTATPKPGMK